MKVFLRLIDILSHTILIVFVVFILLVAVLSSLLRHYSPDIDEYRGVLLEQINSKNKDIFIDAKKISSDWQLFQPQLTLYEVSVRSNNVDEDLALEKLHIKLNFIKSLLKRQLYFDYIELANLDVLLVEDESGQWNFAGQSNNDSEKQSLENAFRRIWAIDELVLKNISVSLLPYKGSLVQLPDGSLHISSYRNKKQFTAQFRQANKNVVQVIVNTKREPDDKKFSLKAYLKVEQYSVSEIAALVPALSALKKGKLTNESWIYWQNGELVFNSKLAIDDVIIDKDKVQWQLHSFKTAFHGSYVDKQWDVYLPKSLLVAGKENLTIGTTRLSYSDKLELRTAQLDIAAIHDFSALFPVPKNIKSELETLSPDGYLQNIYFRLNQDNSFLLKAGLRNIAVGAWNGAPELKSVSGYMEATPTNGFIELDTTKFSMFFPRLYKNPMLFEKAKGYIDWHIGSDDIVVNGKRLILEAESGKAHGEFEFSLPRVKSKYETARLSLNIGMKNTAAQYRNIFIPFVVSDSLVKWLDGNIKSGLLPEVGFIYHGPAQAESHEQRVIQLWLDVKDAALTYADQWPAIENINGQFLLDDNFAYARITSGDTAKLSVNKAIFRLLPEKEGQVIEVSSEVEGTSSQVLGFLKNKPLADKMEHVIDEWKAGNGKISAQVDVVTRLMPDDITTSVNIVSQLDGVDIILPQHNITIQKMTGRLDFGTEAGLSADKLDGVFLGKPVTAKITSTAIDNKSDTSIKIHGSIDIADLARWSEEPLVNFLAGSTLLDAEIYYGTSGSGLRVSSLLRGVEVKLPQPFLKKANDVRELKIQLPFSGNADVNGNSRDRREMDISYGEGINAHFLMGINGIEAGTINLGLNKGEYQKGKIILGGQVLGVDANEWIDVIDRYKTLTNAKVASGSGQSLVFLVENLQIKTLKAYNQTLDSVSFDLFNAVYYWQLGVDHKDLKATLKIYEHEQPMELHLHRVNLEFLTKKQEESGMSYANNTLSEFPDIDVTVDKVIYGGEDFGEWEFNVRSYEDHMTLENMQASFKSMQLTSAAEEGATLSWTFGSHPQTHFQGKFISENIADVLKAWGYKQEVKSQKAEFNVVSSWNGVPADFSFYKVKAVTQMKLEKGNFADVSSSGTDALKLIGVFNIANLVKRLQLDFSDLTGQGLSYDTVVGVVSLDHGVYHFDQPIVIKSPASKIRLYGGFDMNIQQLDMTMGVTLPLASNLPWIVALAAGLPTAAGVFIVSKVLNKQVDQISSAVYEVTGAFDDPQIKFQSLFDTEADLEKQAVKQLDEDKVEDMAE